MRAALGRLTVVVTRNRPAQLDWFLQNGWVCRYLRIDLGPTRIVLTWRMS